MRRTKEERLRDKEERRANRQAKRMAKKNNTKTIDAVSVVAKDGSKKNRKRRGGNERYVSNQPGLQLFGGASNGDESTATETTGKIWGTGDLMILLDAFGAINKPLTRPPLALPSAEEHYVKTVTTAESITTSDKEIIKKSDGDSKLTNNRGEEINDDGKPSAKSDSIAYPIETWENGKKQWKGHLKNSREKKYTHVGAIKITEDEYNELPSSWKK